MGIKVELPPEPNIPQPPPIVSSLFDSNFLEVGQIEENIVIYP